MIPSAHFWAACELWTQASERTVCTLEGNCMAPVLYGGDSIVIQHGSGDIGVGDVVVFGEPGAFLIHRVLRVYRRDGRDQFLVKADQRPLFHAPIARDRILGKVVEVRGSNGHLQLDSPLWRVMNRILSARSYVSGRRHEADTPFWRAVNVLFALRSKLLPEGLSLSLIPCRFICCAHRILHRRRETPHQDGKTEG